MEHCGNRKPDIFSYVFSSSRFPPRGASRGYYSNPRLSALVENTAETSDMNHRRADYVEAQQILACELPTINLGCQNTVVLCSRKLTHFTATRSGNFALLEIAGFNPVAADK